MKKRYVLYVVGIIVALALGIVIACLCYSAPEKFLEGVKSGDVTSIAVFNGSTGRQMILENSDEINTIVNNIKSVNMKRGKSSSGYDGYVFSLTFKDKDGNVIDSFIINSKNVIRDDPFFYECENGELCFAFLQELENKYCVQNSSAELSVYSEGGSRSYELSADDKQYIIDILLGDSWKNALPNCASDLVFQIRDRQIRYHSDCGTFTDDTDQKSIKLSDEQRARINAMLGID